MNKGLRIILSLSACLALSLTGCTKDDSGDSSSGDKSSPSKGDSSKSSGTQCGVVFDGDLHDPVNLDDGEFVKIVSVLSNNLVVIANAEDGSQAKVVKIQGIGSATTTAQNQSAINEIQVLAARGAYFFKSADDCTTSLNGQTGIVGSFITPTGTSIAESLLTKSLSPFENDEACGGDLNAECLQQIADENNVDTFAQLGCGFLWKPTSDKDGSAVVLVDACDARVFVNGEEFTQAGAGNGRCTTARGSRSGCSYGTATIEVYDMYSGAPYSFPDGSTKLVVNGCQRKEFPCS